MSTQIQQQQVQGLVNTVASLSEVSGNLNTTGANLAFDLVTTGINLTNSILLTGSALAATDIALSGNIVNNTNKISATGSYLNQEISLVSGQITLTGTTNANSIVTEQTARIAADTTLTTNLAATGSTLEAITNDISGNLDYTSGKLDTVSGNLALTGSYLSGRVGGNSNVASSLGLATTTSNQLYGEAAIVPNTTSSTRILQWVGDVPAASTIPLHLGGVVGKNAQMPSNSQWFVKMYGNAKSIESADQRAGHVGIYALETGFIIDHESAGSPNVQLTGINGNSGSALSGVHYNLLVGTSGTTPGYLVLSGVNGYTGAVRFHASAYVSQMST
tara:strand:+ start:37 stop:1035 length:999 start_codon:yes stop_codon:yes gene_type:complete